MQKGWVNYKGKSDTKATKGLQNTWDKTDTKSREGTNVQR